MSTETVSVAIDSIDWKYYPRSKPNQDAINQYRQAIEKLPPILVNQNHYGIDGYHRCLAHLQEGKTEIAAEVREIPNEQVLAESIRLNASHGLQLSTADKQRLAPLLFQDGFNDLGAIADLLSVSRRAVENWTRKLRDAQREEEDILIWDMWLACATQEEIADKLGAERSTIAKRIVNLRNDAEIHAPDPLQVYNVWQFHQCDPNLGINYPGRIPGQIVQHLLYYYTEPFDLVVDLFGGGGVTVDACKSMARRYRVYDINPVRPEIKKHDSTTGYPTEAKSAKLAFLDPPYWKQKRGDYSQHETNLANMPAERFHQQLKQIVLAARDNAEYVALLISPTQEDWRFTDHASIMIREIGVPYHRIQVPYSTEIHGGNYVAMAKEKKQWLYLGRDLLIWKQ